MHCVSKDAMVTVLDDRNVSLDGETMSNYAGDTTDP